MTKKKKKMMTKKKMMINAGKRRAGQAMQVNRASHRCTGGKGFRDERDRRAVGLSQEYSCWGCHKIHDPRKADCTAKLRGVPGLFLATFPPDRTPRAFRFYLSIL